MDASTEETMDPKACLRRYVIACRDNDADEVEAAAHDYNAWISRGGFPARLDDGSNVYGLTGDRAHKSPVGRPGETEDRFVAWSVLAGGVS